MVSLDELALGISELVESYAVDVIKEMEKVLDETADKVLAYIQSKHREWSKLMALQNLCLQSLKVKASISVSPSIQALKEG